jgi:hypothetical protein
VGNYDQLFYHIFRGKPMVLEQVRNVKIYKLPLDELHNLAPDISLSNAPTISSDLSPIEVWIEGMPEHMIHYNGEKFLGPYE